MFILHSFFFIRTSNFDAEAERSYIFWRFEAETFLKMFLNLPGIVFQPISADVTRQTIKEHFLLRYGIKLLAHTGLTCSLFFLFFACRLMYSEKNKNILNS